MVGVAETAEAALKRGASFPVHTTGSKAIDSLLGGGLRGGTLTVFYGRSNSGKTQLAMQAAMMCGDAGGKALFVDTEGSFRPERVQEMARERGKDAEAILGRIVYVRSDSVAEQMEAVRQMPVRPVTASCDLVVIDTLTRNFTVELPGRTNLSSRQGTLDVYLSEMARDAYRHSRAYLLTNRVTFGAVQDVGIGGKTVEQLVHRSMILERDGSAVRATLVPSGVRTTAEIGRRGID